MIDLKEILKLYPSCLNSRATFRSLLMDKYPAEKQMVNMLTILFECGIANRISAKKALGFDDMQRFMSQIESEYGISSQHSRDAILIWAAAYDVIVTDHNAQTPAITKSNSSLFTHNSEKKRPKVGISSFNVTDKEFIAWHNSYSRSGFQIDNHEFIRTNGNTLYKITISNGKTGFLYLYHDINEQPKNVKKDNVCAIAALGFDDPLDSSTIIAVIGSHIDCNFSLLDASSQLQSNGSYKEANMTAIHFKDKGHTILTPSESYYEELFSKSELKEER